MGEQLIISCVNPSTAARLSEINKLFYQTFALPFSATRSRIQPGVRRILERIGSQARLLDLGCGNGELARELDNRDHQGPYVGLDSSAALLEQAREALAGVAGFPFYFLEADISRPGWDAHLPLFPFDWILAFAVLHHLPGERLRRQVLLKVHELLAPGGRFVHSEWQFLKSPRLRDRIQPWEKAGLSAAEVDPGDYLLDWRHGGTGLRYVHHFTAEELEEMARETGFRILETFHSDGEGGNLGIYQIWEPI